MSTEPVDLDMWCFWLNVSLNPLGYAASVTPNAAWFYTAREVIRVDDVERRSPLRGYARIMWREWIKHPAYRHHDFVEIRWDMDADKYGDMVDAAFGCNTVYGWCRYHVSSIMREECAAAYILNPRDMTPENLAPRIVRVFDAPPICPGTIWARNKETEMHITYDWSLSHEEHQ